jgi:hypothetical protein
MVNEYKGDLIMTIELTEKVKEYLQKKNKDTLTLYIRTTGGG